MSMQNVVRGMVFVAGAAGAATAGVYKVGQDVTLWGSTRSVESYNVIADVGGSPLTLQPESMAFYNGVLYVGGDRDANETNGKLAAYSGSLGQAPTVIQMGQALDNTTLRAWGPEGMAINTSGSGYGSFGTGELKIASVEGAGRKRAGVINLTSGATIDNVLGNPPEAQYGNYDDLAFSASADAFYAIDGDTNGLTIRKVDKFTMAAVSSFNMVASGAKGLTTISAAFAQLLTGQTVSTGDALLVALEDGVGPLGNCRLAVYDLNGNVIGGEQAFNLAGLGIASAIEAVAVDEANGIVYVGDEDARMIHAFAVPAPGAAALLAAGALVASRRRRA